MFFKRKGWGRGLGAVASLPLAAVLATGGGGVAFASPGDEPVESQEITARANGDTHTSARPTTEAGTATVIVNTTGGRTHSGDDWGTTKLGGVTVVLFSDNGTVRADGVEGLGAGWALAVSDSNGVATFKVPVEAGPAPRYQAREAAVPGGYFVSPTAGAYYRTPYLIAGQTYNPGTEYELNRAEIKDDDGNGTGVYQEVWASGTSLGLPLL